MTLLLTATPAIVVVSAVFTLRRDAPLSLLPSCELPKPAFAPLPQIPGHGPRPSPYVRARLALALLVLLASPVAAFAQATPAQAIALEQQGKLGEAAVAWRAVTERNPRDAGAFASLGVVLAKQQRYPEAAAAYRKALALDPKLPGIQLNLGLAEFKQGRFS